MLFQVGLFVETSLQMQQDDYAGSFINAEKLQKGNKMKWILRAVRLQILRYESICCSEGFGCTVLLTLAVSVNRLLVTDSSESQPCTRRQHRL